MGIEIGVLPGIVQIEVRFLLPWPVFIIKRGKIRLFRFSRSLVALVLYNSVMMMLESAEVLMPERAKIVQKATFPSILRSTSVGVNPTLEGKGFGSNVY